jgi:hypothetical protein
VAVPEEHGGGGGTFTDLVTVTEELAAGGLPLPLLVISPSVCATVLAGSGTPEQKAAWLPGLASGEKVMCFAITEPDAGLNTHALRTRGVRREGGWRIDGEKYYVPRGQLRRDPGQRPGPASATPAAAARCRCSSSTSTPPG